MTWDMIGRFVFAIVLVVNAGLNEILWYQDHARGKRRRHRVAIALNSALIAVATSAAIWWGLKP